MPRAGLTVDAMTYSIVALTGSQPAFEDSWEYAEVRRLLQEAIDEIETALSGLRALSYDTDWAVRDSSIRSLHESLTEQVTCVRRFSARVYAAGERYLF